MKAALEFEKRPKKIRFSFMKACKNFFRETSLHGFRHIEQKYNRQSNIPYSLVILKILLWVFITVCSIVFCVYLMILVWTRFETSPTQNIIESVNYPISQVYFPAVTICNINKVRLTRTETVQAILRNAGLDDGEIMNYLTNLSRLITMDSVDRTVIRSENILEEFGYTPERIMLEVSVPCSSLVFKCSWIGKEVNCSQLFRKVKSSNGFCCSFNYHALREEFDSNYENNLGSFKGIQRISGAGEFVGLSFSVDIVPSEYLSPTEDFIGIEVMIHDSMSFPDNLVTSSVIQNDQDLRISIDPEVTMSNEGIRSMSVKQRACWFEDEMELVTARQYSFENCIAECRARYVTELCGCMPFFFPLHKPRGASGFIKQCSMTDLSCLRKYRHIFYNFIRKNEERPLNTQGMECECLPTCKAINYKSVSNTANKLPRVNYGMSDPNDTRSTVRVFFNDLTCLKYKRDAAMTWDGLFASFGGIIGFCLGGSIISLIELIYYFSLDTCLRKSERRLAPVLPLYRKDFWATKASKTILSQPYQ